ncbi:MAG: hypothetical protein ACM31O_14455 [Bacteroidota bacterium]
MRIGDVLYGLLFLAAALYAAVSYIGTREPGWLFGALGWLMVLGSHCQLVGYRAIVDAAVAQVKGGAV